jgi:hypothetical protein
MAFDAEDIGGSQPVVPVAAHAQATGTWLPVKSVVRVAAVTMLAFLCLGTSVGPSVMAKSSGQADAKEPPAIDPAAMDALNKLGAYLRTLKAFEVRAEVTTDEVLDDGQTIQSGHKVDLVVARPNRFRAEITADDSHQFFFYDGKSFTIFGRLVNYYATVPAPPTLAKLIDDLDNKYGIELPLVDLFEWGTDDTNINKIKGAVDIGPATVDGITCEQYAFRQADVNWQIWIQLGEFPLPRKLVIRTLTDDARPQHSEILSWNLAPSFSEDAFTFDPPTDAKRIPIAEVKPSAGDKK